MWATWKVHEKFNHSVPAYLWYVVEPVLSSRPASTLTHSINKFWVSFLIFLTFLTGLTRFLNDLIILGFILRNILRYCLENSKGAERVKSSAYQLSSSSRWLSSSLQRYMFILFWNSLCYYVLGFDSVILPVVWLISMRSVQKQVPPYSQMKKLFFLGIFPNKLERMAKMEKHEAIWGCITRTTSASIQKYNMVNKT